VLAGAAVVAPIVSQAQATERGRYIVEFKQKADANDLAAMSRLDGRVSLELKNINAFAVDMPKSAVAELLKNKRVRFIEEDKPMYAMGHLSADAGGSQITPYGITMVQADQVPDTTARNRKVCIIDSGYETTHEDLIGGNTIHGVNLTTSGDWNTDELHHGTHVGGTISAVDNQLGVIGVMPNKRVILYIVKVFDASGTAPTSRINQAMQICADHHANVVSMSLGGGFSQSQQQVVTQLAAQNVMMVAAAGNAGNTSISYPAGFAEVISVAAVDSAMAWATFSQFNADVELAAPGVTVKSTVPMGTGADSTLNVGGTNYEVVGIQESPNISATGPLADFGLGDTIIPGGMTGKICLIQRGDITFALKVQNCTASGGIGAAIYNNVPGLFAGTMAGEITTIPSTGANGDDGAELLSKVGQQTTVANAVGNYAYFDGTSMATPHVSAVAALVWSYFPNCTAEQIRTTLDNSAMDLGDAGRDVKFGFGLVQAKKAFARANHLGCGL
jgi:subtilisin family serine protease